MVMRERKGTIDGYEWRCRTKGGENPHNVCKSIRKVALSLSSLLNYLRAFGDGPVAGVPGGQGIESWLACLEFEPSATKDPPCTAAMHVKSIESLNVLSLPDGHGYELVSSVRALVPQKFSVEEELMHVKHVDVKSPHVGVMWKFGRGVIISGIILVT
ncbi:hypothetical protein TNCV_1384611 [Trichonephila clavipes]|nr:hypothetical protein TNCV_1384611 [Trichonephila clavipes]